MPCSLRGQAGVTLLSSDPLYPWDLPASQEPPPSSASHPGGLFALNHSEHVAAAVFPVSPALGRGRRGLRGGGSSPRTRPPQAGLPGVPSVLPPCRLLMLSPAWLGRVKAAALVCRTGSSTGKSHAAALKPTRLPLAPCREAGSMVPRSCATCRWSLHGPGCSAVTSGTPRACRCPLDCAGHSRSRRR